MAQHYIKWAAHGDDNATRISEQVGCWKRMVLHADRKMKTAVWQDLETHKCSLQISGWGGMNGTNYNASEFVEYTFWPPVEDYVCGYKMWHPFVHLLRNHIRLPGNFSKAMEFLAGPKSTCKGIMVSGVSLGGSLTEMVAACASRGRLHELFLTKQFYTNWTADEVYTFGPQASATTAMKNHRAKGPGKCFKGKRFYIRGDWIGQSTGGLAKLRHPHVDTVEFFRGKDGPTYRLYPCWADAATKDENHRMPPQLLPSVTSRHPELLDMRKDKLPHDMNFQKEFLRWFYEAGLLNFSSLDLPVKRHGRSMVPPDALTGLGSHGYGRAVQESEESESAEK